MAASARAPRVAAGGSGVAGGFPVFAAVGLDGARPGADWAGSVATIAGLGADQIWIVVDVGRKPMDTAVWVAEMTRELPVTAVAVVGAAATSSPESVNLLGIPVGWVDGRRATSPVL
ncbi:hypothetical protein [Arthrobacter sp. HLT1-21]